MSHLVPLIVSMHSVKFSTEATTDLAVVFLQESAGVGGSWRGIGSLLGLGGEGRWPQQKAVVSEMASLGDSAGAALQLVRNAHSSSWPGIHLSAGLSKKQPVPMECMTQTILCLQMRWV